MFPVDPASWRRATYKAHGLRHLEGLWRSDGFYPRWCTHANPLAIPSDPCFLRHWASAQIEQGRDESPMFMVQHVPHRIELTLS